MGVWIPELVRIQAVVYHAFRPPMVFVARIQVVTVHAFRPLDEFVVRIQAVTFHAFRPLDEFGMRIQAVPLHAFRPPIELRVVHPGTTPAVLDVVSTDDVIDTISYLSIGYKVSSQDIDKCSNHFVYLPSILSEWFLEEY